MADLKGIMAQVEPLPGSARLTNKEVEEILKSTAKVVGDTNVDWIKRLNMLKTFRSLCSDSTHHAHITSYIRQLMPPLQGAVKDLRSQVAREACLTVAYIAAQFGLKTESFIEPMLPTLFSLLVANAKIVSVTGVSTLCLIYECVQSWRLLPPLSTHISSKSKEVRRAVSLVLKIVFDSWPATTIQRQATVVTGVMTKALKDADAETRQSAREAFPSFTKVFPANAKAIFDSLEPHQQKQIHTNKPPEAPAREEPPTKPPFLSQAVTRPSVSETNSSSQSKENVLIKKTSIPVLTSRPSPTRNATPATQGRSASAIDIQAASRAVQRTFSTVNGSGRTPLPLKSMGRTHSSLTSPSRESFQTHVSSFSSPYSHIPLPNGRTLERARTRTPKPSQSQPASRSSSPSSARFLQGTYKSPYGQSDNHTCGSSITGPRKLSFTGSDDSSYLTPASMGRRRRKVSNSSNSSSRETSPQGRILGPLSRARSVSNSPQIPLSLISANSSIAKLLVSSREAESSPLGEALRREGMSCEVDCGANLSDSEDSISSNSHRSYRSGTFSPPSTTRQGPIFENLEDIMNKCGSAKWSERKEGLCRLNTFLQKQGKIPQEFLDRIGSTFCRIFMDAHTKVLSLFLDALHSLLLAHAKDLVGFTKILLNRVLTKLGSDLLTSVHTKLMMTLEIILEEMPPDIQFSAVANYLCDSTQTPNSRSRVAALVHLFNLSAISFPVKTSELQDLMNKLLDMAGDQRSHEIRRLSEEVLRSLFDMAAPQMPQVLSSLSTGKQDQAKAILEKHPPRTPGNWEGDTVDNISGWNSITSDIQSLRLSQNTSDSGRVIELLEKMSLTDPSAWEGLITELYKAIKDTRDDVLLEIHKGLLKILFNSLTSPTTKSSQKATSFLCLEDLCGRPGLGVCLAEYTELFIVRVTEVQSNGTREVTKAAEACALSLASNFPPETVARAICPIVLNKQFPINQLAIKMLQRLAEGSPSSKLGAILPDMMNALVSAYDHPDSAVRKSAVFAIVALHLKVGSELDPFLSCLNGSKLKLLQLYIQRAQNSPRNP